MIMMRSTQLSFKLQWQKLNFKGDGDTVVHRDLGTELIISGGNTDSTTLTENNIGVVADKDSGSLSVKLSKNVNLDDGSVTFVETAKDADGNALVKGEDGNWYADLTDAVYDADDQRYTKMRGLNGSSKSCGWHC